MESTSRSPRRHVDSLWGGWAKIDRAKVVLAILMIAFVCTGTRASAQISAEVEHFEKKIRPLFAEHCEKCHGADKQKGGLRLDSRVAILKGGDSGPAIDEHDGAKSLLLEVLRYEADSYQMPPSGKLSAEQIASVDEWIKRGAVWPGSDAQMSETSGQKPKSLDVNHWSLLPIPAVTPPAAEIPNTHPIDAFLDHQRKLKGLTAGPRAEKSVLLRRLSWGLTGLPPTRAELEEWLADERPNAIAHLIDRLLASPRYGERWGRHWLDLMRFAETGGHEFDYVIPHTWPYRDYVIRSLNEDVGYDQFLVEHLAGDLLPTPRRDLETGKNLSVAATAFYWLGQGKHSPVDLKGEECDTIDNQIDVLSKSFLGLTIACARCHDHKFDPLLQKDYYALAGFLQSSRRDNVDMNDGPSVRQRHQELKTFSRQKDAQVRNLLATRMHRALDQLNEILTTDSDSHDDVWRTLISIRRSPRHPWSEWADSMLGGEHVAPESNLSGKGASLNKRPRAKPAKPKKRI